MVCVTWINPGTRTVTSRTTLTAMTSRTNPAARPRDQPRLAFRAEMAGSIAKLRKNAMTNVLIKPRALSKDSTMMVVPSPIQITRQIVCRMMGATQLGALSKGLAAAARTGCSSRGVAWGGVASVTAAA